jgi:nucleoside-diphosphate-sugar epimerase
MGVAVLVGPARVLVTGASGFIGRALTGHLLSSGYQVQGTVRRKDNTERLPNGLETVVVPEIGPHTDWEPLLGGIEAVVHLAARVHRREGRGDQQASGYFRINAEGTARLARASAARGVKRLIFMSTVKVNGEGARQPYRESDAEDPKGAYAESKLAAESALSAVSAQSGLETVILRAPLVYGPGVKANFRRLVRLVERQIPLPLAGIANRRSLLYVGNLLEAITLSLKHPSAAGQTYLLADGECLSTPQLVRDIAYRMGITCRLFHCPLSLLRLAAALTGRRKDLRRLVDSLYLDTRKIQESLRWRPRYSYRTGLAATLAEYRKDKPPRRHR